MNVLVTGGAGFIGSHLIDRLLGETDARITCLDNFNDYYSPARKRTNVERFRGNGRVQVVEASFCDADAMQSLFSQSAFTHVVHLGAYAGVRPSVFNPLVYEENNVRGTMVLLEAARAFPVERFLLASSSTVYGRGAEVPFAEDAPLGIPMSPYGATKRSAEILGLTYLDLHRVPVSCLRFFSVYGSRMRPDLALYAFSAAIVAGRPLTLYGDGSVRRDFTHIHDICDGLMATLRPEANIVGECLNLGHSEPIEIREVITRLEQRLGRKAEIRREPPSPGDMPVTCADVSKSGRLLGYKPRVPFEAGLDEFAAWFLDQHRA